MGTVYRVLDHVTGEERALKRIHPNPANRRFAVEALQREYQVLASLDHPRIIRVYDYGVDDAGPYYTMELLEGRDMREAAPLPHQEACLYLRDIASSLVLLHARGLIHRDLSPANVRITADGHCKLLDFGALVPFGRQEKVVGTPPLVPPEAVEGGLLDQRADLYALGALAYWILTGRHAYPARQVGELLDLWKSPPLPPSSFAPSTPSQLDALVVSLLSADPLARPASAAEVIARFNAIGDLPPEGSKEVERLAMSFLASPRFTGRSAELSALDALVQGAVRGRGAAVCIEALPGMGRTRLLDEIGVRAQLAGAVVLRADATAHRYSHGTARTLVLRLFEALPGVALERARRFRAALSSLGGELVAKLGGAVPPAPSALAKHADPFRPLEGWFAGVAEDKPLVLLVDNVDHADDASLGVLAALARLSHQSSLLVVVTRQSDKDAAAAIGLEALRAHSSPIELLGLNSGEMLELTRSLFGDAPNVERFAEWLRGQTAGTPLHALEIVRQLVANQVIRYNAGIWTLPATRPEWALPSALGDVLASRIASLGSEARALAERLALQRERATFELCRLVTENADDRLVFLLLGELAQADVLYPDADAYRFSSTAVRDALLRGMNETRLHQNHRRLGEAFAELAARGDVALRIEAGWHLIQGNEEMRGANLIASVTHDAVTARQLTANLHRIGPPLQAALEVYNKQRRSVYERMPLLATLAQAGYYEDRTWGERYGYAALDVLEEVSGLRTARMLRRFVGKRLSLVLGLLLAFARFQLAPRRERNYTFVTVLVQLFGTVTALTGTASLSFDSERAERTADVLEPFAWLPPRLTPVGIYEFCRGLQEVGRENQPFAYDTFNTLLERFEDPKYYPTLPANARTLYIAGVHSVRGILATFRADGRGALESADALEMMGLKLYAMIASEIRFLYHTLRGEVALAAPHREQVEVHAAHVGSAWQVETWESAVLILVQASLSDPVGSARGAQQLETLSRAVPSLKRYARLASQAYGHVVSAHETVQLEAVASELRSEPPRSYAGWGAAMGSLARRYNDIGKHSEAKAVCERVAEHLTDADREYVSHFLVVDIELARADAGLAQPEKGLARINGLLERFRGSGHPLAMGLLHEARARIAWASKDAITYAQSLAEVEAWFLPTGTPPLIAKAKRLAELQNDSLRPPPAAADLHSTSEAGASTARTTVAEDASRIRTLRPRKSDSD
jgi:hypothetical protein